MSDANYLKRADELIGGMSHTLPQGDNALKYRCARAQIAVQLMAVDKLDAVLCKLNSIGNDVETLRSRS